MPAIATLALSGSTLERLNTLRGWLKTDLARESGVSVGRISAAFNGNGVNPRTAKKIADALGVKIADLLPEAEQVPA